METLGQIDRGEAVGARLAFPGNFTEHCNEKSPGKRLFREFVIR
jgi:hypothetical protein